MPVDLFGIGTSALLSFKRGIATVGHNIANVNTPGFNRQRTEQVTRPPQFIGVGYLGQGTQVSNVRRIFDQVLFDQVISSSTSFKQQEAFLSYSARIDGLVAGNETGLNTGLQSFFDSIQASNSDPTSIASRQVMLSESTNLVKKFQTLSQYLNGVSDQLDKNIRQQAVDISGLAQGIADLNQAILETSGVGRDANDLLDQRDELIRQVSEKVSIRVLEQSDGTQTVFIGSGQVLVIGNNASTLEAIALGADPNELNIAITDNNGTQVDVSRQINGGELGGLIDFRDNQLRQTLNSMGRIAIGVAMEFNAQHQQGLDLNGDVGEQYFNLPSAAVYADPNNSTFGVSSITVAFDNASGLSSDDYRMDYDGATWSLTNLRTNQNVPLTPSGGDFLADGLLITPDPGAIAGDSYIIRPTRSGAREIDLLITDPRDIAIARTHVTSENSSNTGAAGISATTVLDPLNPSFFNSFTVVFDSPGTYQINGVGASIPYVSGANIDINGIRFQITGVPALGDSFAINNNQGAVGDNANGLQLSALQNALTMEGGTASFQGINENLVGLIGTQTREARVSFDAQQGLLAQAVEFNESVSGVSLDEEAAKLTQLQQYYQAAAQVISAADTIFNTLLSVTRR